MARRSLSVTWVVMSSIWNGMQGARSQRAADVGGLGNDACKTTRSAGDFERRGGL